MPVFRVKSATFKKTSITLYLEDGTIQELTSPEYDINKISKVIISKINNNVDTVIINTDNYTTEDIYKEFEDNSNKLIKFYKITKKKLKDVLFGSSDKEVENIPHKEIIENSIPIAEAPKEEPKEEIAIVAVTADEKVIPNIDQIENHIKQANVLNRTQGLVKLMERLSKVIDQRSHSVDDVLKFLNNADLPIADDGSIIAYKVLRKTSTKDVYVDCHTGRVKQKVGSIVSVDPSLINLARYQECAAGLHIARRGYIGSFSGDVILLTKVNPEDIYVVPHRDANKVRVAAYENLAVLPDEAYNLLKKNKPMTSVPEAAELLNKAIAGQFPPPIEVVHIKGELGTNLQIKPIVNKTTIAKAKEVVPVDTVDNVLQQATENNIEELKKIINKPPTRKEVVRKLFEEKKYQEIIEIKTKAKISYRKLGFTQAEEKKITNNK